MPEPTESIRVAVVGAGNIAGPYTENLTSYAETDLVGIADLDPAKAKALAAKRDVTAYPDLDALLADDIDLVVNLSIHHAHYEVTKVCLEAGKPIYSEKPLAMRYEEAKELVALAEHKGLRLGCSPFTFLGEAQQAAWQLVREERLGTVRVAYAEVNWGRIEAWHPAPAPFYEVGALFDVGVYPLTLLTAMFGPARRVSAQGRILHPNRTGKTGEPFTVTTPDFVTATLDLEGGVVVRLTTNFYVTQRGKQTGIELHGDAGSLHLSSWQNPDATLEFAEFGQAYEPVPLHNIPGIQWGRGVQEMAAAMLDGRPHRVTGEQAAHIVEILNATTTSLETERPVEIGSSFPLPAPLGKTAP
ncbi:Gfo/Idh/MocA family oxidoreductase [soil metagenome]